MSEWDEPQTISSSDLVEGAQGLGGLVGEMAVFVGGLVADLPGAVHLVAEAPELDVPRLLAAVLLAQVAPVGAARVVDVFDEVARLVEAARAEVDRQHHLGADRLAPVGEFVDADLRCVRTCARRGRAASGAGRAGRCRLPSCRPRRNCRRDSGTIGDVEVAHQLEHVAAHAVRVGGRMAGLVDAGIDRAAEMLEK